eukprot:11376361-Ditylum_brightwellii.AAC.1
MARQTVPTQRGRVMGRLRHGAHPVPLPPKRGAGRQLPAPHARRAGSLQTARGAHALHARGDSPTPLRCQAAPAPPPPHT